MVGRLTLPTDADIVEETIRLKNLLGADALIDDNTFYVRKGVPFVRKNMGGGNYVEVNNKFIELFD